MTAKDYIKKAMRTEGGVYPFSAVGELTPRMEHAVYGLVTESAELMSQVKKVKIYSKELDKVNLLEEAGDLMWYLALLCDELGVSFEEIWEQNISKLRIRYPEKFSSEKALKRDLHLERKVLEKKSKKHIKK